MKGLYIYFDRQNPGTDGNAVGILKKVRAQHALFGRELTGGDAGDGCELVNLALRCGSSYAVIFLSCLFSRRMFDLSFLDGKKYDYVYVRRVTPNCRSVLHILRRIRGANPACRIVYEIPTYPYDAEHRSFAGMFVLLVDRHFRKKLSRYVDRIATLTDDGRIFGCPALRIRNGVDVASIPVCGKTGYGTGCLHMIAVAQFSFWHGYERVLEGMRDYYASGGRRKLVLHLVGDGPEMEKYRSLAGQYEMGEHIVFHGTLSGSRLAEAFDTADSAGFRTGTCRPYKFINPGTKKLSSITIHPLQIMECTLDRPDYMGLDYQEALSICKRLTDETYRHGGELNILWHNTSFAYDSYQDSLYTAVLDYIARLSS
ncbi:MAG: hypothetical protein II837_06485 [Treponema sp.]|nr:hypothetical protein [Treponema sp.]